MPYRRLPNTDKARLRALKIALLKGKELPPFKLAFSQKSNHKLQSFLPGYENAISFYNQSFMAQTRKTREYYSSMKKARMYISHFIQVVNMAIMRGEIRSETREFFGLDVNESRIPSLHTEKDIIFWGEKIIKGEAKRILEGAAPVTNPTIAIVKVRYESFMEAYHHQKTLQKNTVRTQEDLSLLRKEADDIVVQLWNEVEESFKDLPDDLKRGKAGEYGVVYVYRKNETVSVNFFNSRQSGAG